MGQKAIVSFKLIPFVVIFMSWSIVLCQEKGGRLGIIDVFVETDDIDKAKRMIEDNKNKILQLNDYSVQEEHMYDISDPSFSYDISDKSDVREEIKDLYSPDYAICADGTVFWMENVGEVVKV